METEVKLGAANAGDFITDKMIAEDLPSTFEIFETDLPICCNINEVQVLHYILDMKFLFNKRIVLGSAIIFVKKVRSYSKSMVDNVDEFCQKSEPSFISNNTNDVTEKDKANSDCKNCSSEIILDACALKVSKVSYLQRLELAVSPEGQRSDSYSYWMFNPDSNFEYIDKLNPTRERQHDWHNVREAKELQFQQSKWALTIYNTNCSQSCKSTPPPGLNYIDVIRIDYQTTPETPSLHWRPSSGYEYNESYYKVVYTPAAPVNNRGLFPCQEASTAFATWEALIHVEQPYLPLLASDKCGIRLTDDLHYFYSTHLMPVSTFAIIISVFPYVKEIVTTVNANEQETQTAGAGLIPTRLISVSPVLTLVQNLEPTITNFTKQVLKSAYNLFGPLPFQRIDLIIMPQCFHTLGLANPNMIFLSPSILTGSKHTQLFYSRIPHEICHFWFGLGIGALDWTEEWLSEGFATFVEDLLYLNARKLDNETSIEELETELKLKACLRLLTLQNELSSATASSVSTDSMNLQRLVGLPSGNGKSGTATNELVEEDKTVRNGLVPLKRFLQVHYLKGYFFLMELAKISGTLNSFTVFLRHYIQNYNGKLVTSKEFVEFFCNYLKTGSSGSDSSSLPINVNMNLDAEELCTKWLHTNSLPEPLNSVNVIDIIRNRLQSSASTPGLSPNGVVWPKRSRSSCTEDFKNQGDSCCLLNFSLCQAPFEKIRKIAQRIFTKKSVPVPTSDKVPFLPNELILLLEYILDTMENSPQKWPPVKAIIIKFLELIEFEPDQANPEILHRWFELLLKYICQCKKRNEIVSKFYSNSLNCIENFLLTHPAMGLYLYGELMITEQENLQKLAKDLYYKQVEILDPEAKSVLKDMLF